MPDTSEEEHTSLVSSFSSSVHVYREGTNTGKHRKDTINAMHNMMHAMTWQYECVLANAPKTRLNEVGLNPRFKFKTPYVDI